MGSHEQQNGMRVNLRSIDRPVVLVGTQGLYRHLHWFKKPALGSVG